MSKATVKYEIKADHLGCEIYTEKSVLIPTGHVKLTDKVPQKVLAYLYETGCLSVNIIAPE